MSNMTSESKDKMMSDDCIDSPSFDEASSGGGNVGSNMLKKGPWTSAEDSILVEYVNKHGEGNWNAVQKHSGLSRCGKSCRLRWANHLRPDLKKGAFTPEEERHIIELHAKMGNKWARMAAELPGRTDNEIKNFWNTRIKRRQRAGLPIYPPDICSQAFDENEQSHYMGTFSTGNNTSNPKNFSAFNFDIPAVEFECLEVNQTLYPPPTLLDITSKTVLSQALGSSCSNNSLLFPPIPGYFDNSENIFGFSSSYDDHNMLNADLLSSSSGSHALLNGNFSTSGPASKIELPSLQYSSDTQVDGGSWWGSPSSPLPSLESVDTLIQSPPPTDGPTQQQQPDESHSPVNNGLLESIVYESRSLKRSKKNPCDQRYSDGGSVAVAAGDVVVGGGGSTTQIRDADWGEVYRTDPISPLGHSATSVFTEYTTPASGSSFEDPDSVETVPGGANAKPAVEWDPTQCGTNTDISNQIKYLRPDLLLGSSNWFGSNTERGKDHSALKDAIGQLLGEEDSFTCRNFNHYSAASSSSRQGGPDSCEWKSF